MGNNRSQALKFLGQDRPRHEIPQDTPENREKKLASIAETQRIFYQYKRSQNQMEKEDLLKQLIERSKILSEKEKALYKVNLPLRSEGQSTHSGVDMSSETSSRVAKEQRRIQKQVLRELDSLRGIAPEKGQMGHIYMLGQSGNSYSTRATVYGPIQGQKDQEQADKKRDQAKKCHAQNKLTKSYEMYEQALQLSIQCSRKRPSERTAVIYNERGVVLYNMRNFQKAIQSINKSLEQAKQVMKISAKQVQEWYYWQAVMGNLILALKSIGDFKFAQRLENEMIEDLKIHPQAQIIQAEHITALFSSKQENNGSSSTSKKGSQNPNQDKNFALNQLKTDLRHIQDVSNYHLNISHRIIQSSYLSGRNYLLTKSEIFSQIKSSLKSRKQRHIFIFSGQGQRGYMWIKTKDHPQGEPLYLEEIFDNFILSQDVQHIKTLIIYLDCSFAGSMALGLLKSMPQRNLKSIQEKDVKVICSSGRNNENLESEEFGGLLICNYWESRIPNVLSQEQKNMFSQRLEEANACMIQYIREHKKSSLQSGWSKIQSVTWDGIQKL